MDSETQGILSDQERAGRLLGNSDWLWAKGKLQDFLLIMDSISTIPKNKTPEEKLKLIEVRTEAIAIVKSWIEEVEGTAHAAQVPQPESIDEVVTRFK